MNELDKTVLTCYDGRIIIWKGLVNKKVDFLRLLWPLLELEIGIRMRRRTPRLP